MSISHAILRDLVSGQTTADSAAGRLKIETEIAETILNRHVTDKYAITQKIGRLIIYQITDAGREKINPSIPS